MVKKVNRYSWEEMYEIAKIYYNHYGNLEVPVGFKTSDGFTYDSNGKYKLGFWVNNARSRVDPLSNKGILLQEIGMRFDFKTNKWQEMYELAREYYLHNGNLDIPLNFKTDDGYTYDNNGKYKLGSWLIHQRYLTNEDKKHKLEAIGMNFASNKFIETWEEMYNLAKEYYEHYGNLKIPRDFRTNDGYTYDSNGKYKLGVWLSHNRQFSKPESKRGQLLQEIGLKYGTKRKKYPWEEMYEIARKYYLHYGNLEVPVRFKTSDGYTYDSNGKYNLGAWIFRQRYLIDKESKKGQLLRNIGMVWGVRKNKAEIQELCNENNILYELNEDILLHMSIQEFQAKLGFLRELNLPIIEENDILNPIFSMSNLNMQANYNVSLEELMDKYYAKESSSLVRKYCG